MQPGNILLPLAIQTTTMHGSQWIEEVEKTIAVVDPNERWTAQRCMAQFGSILKGETSVAEAVGEVRAGGL
ncbi:hypothetical protein AYO43_07260 [Nitrospira sp. SCGC AG-212-E16]|nr:hypothetical protein AYO43_07260 [Nitrospira sp. SCGC AG-212-E16]